jgi:5-methylcytosine-specific restriction enzyme subunit McrC
LSPASVARHEATEYRESSEILLALEAAGYTRDHAIATLTRLGSRLKRQLSIGDETEVISINGGATKIMNLAGVLPLAPGVEVDLAPKFLGHEHLGWREDWLAIANLTGQGRILFGSEIAGSYGRSSDLASLIGRSFVAGYRENEHRPLRLYRRHEWSDWILTGEIDVESTGPLDRNGYSQTSVSLDLLNPFNAVIGAAATALLGQIRDPTVRAQLARIRSRLPEQPISSVRLPPVPSRHRRWAPLLELSQQILATYDVTLRPSSTAEVLAPGFLVRTWQAWERLIYVALRKTWGDRAARFQLAGKWGMRRSGPVEVKPDVTMVSAAGRAPIDAKYKTRVEFGRRSISQTDLMETVAFADACESPGCVLLYPKLVDKKGGQEECGACEVFDQVWVGAVEISGVEVEVRGIGALGGYETFSRRLASDVAKLHPGIVDD